jgi:hypothetical protein
MSSSWDVVLRVLATLATVTAPYSLSLRSLTHWALTPTCRCEVPGIEWFAAKTSHRVMWEEPEGVALVTDGTLILRHRFGKTNSAVRVHRRML